MEFLAEVDAIKYIIMRLWKVALIPEKSEFIECELVSGAHRATVIVDQAIGLATLQTSNKVECLLLCVAISTNAIRTEFNHNNIRI